jgi:hypothetical protein
MSPVDKAYHLKGANPFQLSPAYGWNHSTNPAAESNVSSVNACVLGWERIAMGSPTGPTSNALNEIL